MKATGIVRRIDDLGKGCCTLKEIRRDIAYPGRGSIGNLHGQGGEIILKNILPWGNSAFSQNNMQKHWLRISDIQSA